jgi:hypothetical protein
MREVVEEMLVLGQALHEAQGQEAATTHLLAHALAPLETSLHSLLANQQADHATVERLTALMLTVLREAHFARSLSYAALEYFLGSAAARRQYEQAAQQIGDLLTPSAYEQTGHPER